MTRARSLGSAGADRSVVPDDRESPPRRPGRWFLAVFALTLVVYVASPVTTSTDSRWSIYSAIELVDHHTLSLDDYASTIIRDRDHRYAVIRHDGHLYSAYPYGSVVLAAPVVFVATKGASAVLGVNLPALYRTRFPDALERFVSSLFVALAAGVMFLVGLEMLRRLVPALAASLVFAFCTSAWSVDSRALWMHGPGMLLTTVALLLFAKARRNPRWVCLAGLPVGFSYVVRPTNAAALALFTALVGLCYRRQLGLYLAGVAASLVPFFAVNRVVFGAWQPIYYHARLFEHAHVLEGLAGNLVSPARGLLVFSPVLAFAVLGVALRARRGQIDGLDVVAGSAVLLQWVVISVWQVWWGGFSFGPRLFSEAVPFLVYLMLPAVAWLFRPWGAFSVGSRGIATAFVLLAIWSFFVNFRGATSIETFAWNVSPVSVDRNQSRLWDWGDLQFLRGGP